MTSENDRFQIGRYLTEPSIRIVASEHKKEYHVHRKVLLSCKSPKLNALVRGDWNESKEGVIDWTEFNQDANELFLTFLYIRDYSGPIPEHCAIAHKENGDAAQVITSLDD
ncbi:hypothetical protein AOQ84DRAFT_417353 [Glonium stellatum]|uniref:BTB domain-containing protein n=1 Tax=Glonium stellatum TaxID=574774 RepID=A0A8E2JNR7_9PEZI|nr:hypothetical protein AOQ84DRAFT_417353 [Glonium stellatum]